MTKEYFEILGKINQEDNRKKSRIEESYKKLSNVEMLEIEDDDSVFEDMK